MICRLRFIAILGGIFCLASGVVRAQIIETPAAPPPAVSPADHGPYVPMMFPMVTSDRFQKELVDTWGDVRGGGTRRHEGQDMMAPQMTPMVAVFDGVVAFSRTDKPNAHNMLSLRGDNGWTAVYMHINNDTPGTNDGMGSPNYAFAPNLRPGMRVIAGQLVAYVGNSGNAETVGHHLHFELHSADGAVNGYTALKRAQQLTSPRLILPAPEIKPAPGETRLDAVVREADASGGILSITPVAWSNAAGKMTIELKPGRKIVRLEEMTLIARRDSPAAPLTREDIKPGDDVIIIADSKESPSGLSARRLLVQSPPTPEIAFRSRAVFAARKGSTTFSPAARQETAFLAPPPELAARMLERINFMRSEQGIPPLALEPHLNHAAQSHSAAMAMRHFFRTIGADGKDAAGRVAATGYKARTVYECLAGGQNTPEKAVELWKSQFPQDRRALMDARYTVIGIGYAYRADAPLRYYWTVAVAAP